MRPRRRPEVNLRIGLARRVGVDGGPARILSPDNQLSGWTDIDTAVKEGTPFAVLVCDDILALDCDRPAAVDTLWRIYETLVSVGIQPVVLHSGQAEHLHLFAWVSNTKARQTLSARARSGGLDVRIGQWMRPPLTPHRQGLPVDLIEPRTPLDALTALTAMDADVDTRLQAYGLLMEDPSPPSIEQGVPIVFSERQALSPHMQRLLREGDRAGDYRSRSEVIQAITTAAVASGWDFDDLYEALSDPENVGGQRLQEDIENRGEAAARSVLQSGWDKAIRIVATRRSSISVEQVAAWKAAAVVVITGPGATSDRLVFEALLEIAEKAGTLEVNASHRGLADMVTIAKGTAGSALKRLQKRGLITPLEKTRRVDQAKTYRLEVPSLSAMAGVKVDPPDLHPPSINIGGSNNSLQHDLWRNRTGLGKTVGLTWLCLTDIPQPPEILAGSRGVTMRTINKHLRRLESFQLAENAGEGWTRVQTISEEMDALAAELGSLGRAEKQHQMHEAERRYFKDTFAGDPKGTGWERYHALRNRRRR